MFRVKAHHVFLGIGLMAAPIFGYAASFCVAVSNGFGNGGTTFIAPSFTPPAANSCAPWSGFTKTASTVIAFATGTGCMANNNKVMTLTIMNTDPSFFGSNAAAWDQIVLCRTGTTACGVTGSDSGNFSGPATEVACTANLLKLPVGHD